MLSAGASRPRAFATSAPPRSPDMVASTIASRQRGFIVAAQSAATAEMKPSTTATQPRSLASK
eukprot:1984290-Prymnesium_polylepis.1